MSNFIVEKYFNNLEVVKLKYKLGDVIQRGSSSRGLYAIMSKNRDIVLRVSLTKEHAELLTECDSRYVRELFILS